MPALLLRPPPASMAQGIVTHIDDQRSSVDVQEAQRQHDAYANVFHKYGWGDVVVVPRDDALPDSVFVEDGVVSVQRVTPSNDAKKESSDGLFILASPGAEARAREVDAIVEVLQSKEMSSSSSTSNGAHKDSPIVGRCVARIERPGTLDGGDVLKVASQRIIYIGESARTNAEGIRQFTELVAPLGWRVSAVPVKKALHLKSMLTALPDGTIIGHESLVEDTHAFDKFVAMPEAEGVAVVLLDPHQGASSPLLLSSSAPRSAALLQEMGYTVVTTDVSEFEKLEGCVTCLSVRVRP